MAIAQTVRRRVVGDLEIIFYAHDELIVRYRNTSLLFHCWFVSRRRETFRPFRKALMYQKDLKIGQIYEIAERNNVQNQHAMYTHSRIKEAERLGTIIELSSKGRASNRG